MPQAPLTSGPIIMRPGTKPPATGWPLSGATTNQATSVGKIAPNSSAAIQYPAPRGNLGSTQEKTKPQTPPQKARSAEHTSELQSLMRISYAVFCLKKNKDK